MSHHEFERSHRNFEMSPRAVWCHRPARSGGKQLFSDRAFAGRFSVVARIAPSPERSPGWEIAAWLWFR